MGQFDKDTARAAGKAGGKKSAQTRQRRAAIKKDVQAREAFEEAAADLAGVVIDAALGRGDYAKLDPKDRANFAVKGLEWGVGRPRAVTDEPVSTEPQVGLHFDVAPVEPAPESKGSDDDTA